MTPHTPLLHALQEGTLALFLGGDMPEAVTGVPSRAALAQRLAQRYDVTDSASLAQVAQRVSQHGNRFAFTEFLRNALDTTGLAPQGFHWDVVAMLEGHPIDLVITTAYDNLLERALQEAHIPFNRVVRDSDLAFLRPERLTLIKLYGDPQQPDTLVITEDDHYALWRDRDKEDILDEVRAALRRNTVLFLGYNLGDPDFHLLWREVLDRAGRFARPAFAYWPDLPEADVQMWRDRGIVILEHLPSFIFPQRSLEDIGPEEALEGLKEGLPIAYGLESLPGPEMLTETTRSTELRPRTLRVDAAVPESVYVEQAFEVAVAVRQEDSPVLQEADLTRVDSGDVQVTWPAEQPWVSLRIEISAPDCEIHGSASRAFQLYEDRDSPVFYFQLTPKRAGQLSIVVTVYQEDYWLGSARVRTQAQTEAAGIVRTHVVSQPLEAAYFDLQVRVGAQSEAQGGYPVEASLSDGSHFEDGVFRIDGESLKDLEGDPARYGARLWNALFTGPIRDAYLTARAKAPAKLRLRLWLDDDAPELHGLIWESLHRPVTGGTALPVAAAADTVFSRYIGLPQADPAPVTTRPLHMLVAVANPADLGEHHLPSLDVAAEVNALLDSLDQSEADIPLQLTLLPGRTDLPDALYARVARAGHRVQPGATSLDALLRALSQNETYHILHFLGHGGFDRARETAVLFLEDKAGNVQVVKDQEFVTGLASVAPLPHLIFLAACKSAARDKGTRNPFVGLAPQLIQVGVPAVVAMQDQIPIADARQLTRDFYSYLRAHGLVDRSLAQARLLLYADQRPAWTVPVLLMRLKDGRLLAPET